MATATGSPPEPEKYEVLEKIGITHYSYLFMRLDLTIAKAMAALVSSTKYGGRTMARYVLRLHVYTIAQY